jgi:hypothetical protein
MAIFNSNVSLSEGIPNCQTQFQFEQSSHSQSLRSFRRLSEDYQKIMRSIRSPHESKEQHGVYPSLPFSSFCLLDENLLRVRVLCGRLLGLPQPVIPVAPGICNQKIHQIGVSKWGIPLNTNLKGKQDDGVNYLYTKHIHFI